MRLKMTFLKSLRRPLKFPMPRVFSADPKSLQLAAVAQISPRQVCPCKAVLAAGFADCFPMNSTLYLADLEHHASGWNQPNVS
jgi:hypothetical protein